MRHALPVQSKMKAAARLALLGTYDARAMLLTAIRVRCAILQVWSPALSSRLSASFLHKSSLRLPSPLCRVRAVINGTLHECMSPAIDWQSGLSMEGAV